MGYSNSSLTNLTMLSPNHSGQRTHAIDTITVHCVVGQLTAAGIGGCFTSTARQASCNYGIGSDGKVVLVVEEKNRSWCTSSNANDQRAITIECASDAYAPYAFTNTVYNKLVELVTDICKRNGIKKLVWSTNANIRLNHANGCNLTVHRDYDNKSCPGDWMYNKMGEFANTVNARLGAGGSATVTPSTPTTSTPANQSSFPAVPFTVEVKVPDLNIRTSASNANNSNLTGKFTGKGTFTITKVSGLWGYLKSNAGWIYLGNSEYVTIGKSLATSTLAASKYPSVPFTVEVKVPDLNIRTSASNANNSNLTGKFTGKGTFTIVKVSGDWGYLKSNAGWIYLGNSEYVTIGKTVTKTLKAGSQLNLNNVALYGSSSATAKAGTKTGTFYAWSAEVVNGKVRITNSAANVGKSGQVTGWITQADANKSLA